MNITTLIEDTPGARGGLYEHGLCFYIETAHHKVLLDTGASDAAMRNAEAWGIDLGAVDTVVISHGHYDHAGGVLPFTAINPHATIYIHQNAVGEFCNLKNGGEKYIGMDPAIASLRQVIFLDGDLCIDDELTIFSGVDGRRLWPRGNATLQRRIGGAFVQDEFDHEQYLVITEGAHRVLLSGCAHNGILNILDTYRARFGGAPTHVISGFHTVLPDYTAEDDALIASIARELSATDTTYYTGHCTGEHAMDILRRISGEQVVEIHSGDVIRLTSQETIPSRMTELFRSVLDQDRAPVVICDLAHTVVYMNPAAIEHYRTQGGGTLLGRSLLSCHSKKAAEMIKRVVTWFAESREHNMLYTFRNPEENKDVYMVALRDGDGRLIGYYEKHEYRNAETAELYDFSGSLIGEHAE